MKLLIELLLGTILACAVCVLIYFGWLVMWS